MNKLSNLRLGVRLGASFTALAIAALVAGLVGINAASGAGDRALNLAQVNLPAVDTAGQLDGLINADAHDVVRHLYVFDGDLKTEDQIAASVASQNAALAKDVAALGNQLESPAQRSAYRSFVAANQQFVAHLNRALAISRSETIRKVEERDGSRNLYLQKVLPASQTAVASLHRLTTLIDRKANREAHDASSAASRSSNMILVVLVIAVIGAIALAVVVTRGIVGRVRTLADRLESLDQHCVNSLEVGLAAIAVGDLTVGAEPVTQPIENPGADEIGDASRSTNELIDKLRSSLASYNGMREQLVEMIGQISTTSRTLNTSSVEMASTSEQAGRAVGEIAGAVGDVASNAEQQLRKIESSRALAEEMAETSKTSSEDVQETAAAATRARELASEGADAVQGATEAMRAVRASSEGTTEAMRELGAKSEQITGIVAAITGIAEQTNLLALNAAIEAARAGEQGRGFAVVAEEVRKLAEESQSAAASITGLIGEIHAETQRAVEVVEDGAKRTEAGTATVDQAREAFLRLGESVDDMSARIERIAQGIATIAEVSERMQHDMTEVAAVAEQSSASTEEVSAATEQTSASAEQIAASAQELSDNAEQLTRLVGRFRLTL
jgi:methyl-accepting chemotaxis protein